VPTSSAPQPEAAFRGSVLRAYLETMRGDGVLDRVLPHVDAEVRGLLDMPPTSSELVPARITNALIEGHCRELGEDATRAMARRANRVGIVRIIEPIIRTAMRLGGGGPAAIFSRLDLILKRQQRGYELGWDALGENAGRVRLVSHGLRESGPSLVSWEGALSIAFDLTSTTGTVRAESRRFDGAASHSALAVRWS